MYVASGAQKAATALASPLLNAAMNSARLSLAGSSFSLACCSSAPAGILPVATKPPTATMAARAIATANHLRVFMLSPLIRRMVRDRPVKAVQHCRPLRSSERCGRLARRRPQRGQRTPQRQSAAHSLVAGAALHLLQRLVDGEGGRPLPRRELLERGQELLH